MASFCKVELDENFQLICARGELHLWRINLDGMPSALQRLRSVLSSEELQRASRFHDDTTRTRWMAAHGALRCILGKYTGERPETIEFTLGTYGKPGIAGSSQSLFFNLSHSRDLATVAVSASGAVGVDIEHIDPLLDLDDLIQRLFSPREREQLLSLPEQDRRRLFFTAWTRKEAVAKAIGSGLSLPLNRVEVSMQPDAPARLDALPEDDPAQWTLIDIGQQSVAGTAAVRQKTAILHTFTFQEPPA